MGIPKAARNMFKPGQLWQKKDTGVVVEIIGKHAEPYVKTRKLRCSRNATHIISKYDLTKHYQRI